MGLTFVLVTLLALTQMFHLDAVNWLLKRFSVYLAIAFVIIFQPEIRRARAELGKQHVFTTARERTLVDQIVGQAGYAPAKQPQYVVRCPAAMPDPAPAKIVFTRHACRSKTAAVELLD